MSHGRNIYARVHAGTRRAVSRSPSPTSARRTGRRCSRRIAACACCSLHFDLDRPTLREFESEPTLEKLADLLKSKNAPAVEIQGHMDNIGEAGAAARQTLSEGRAKIVASWLVAHGVPAAKVTSKGYGKDAADRRKRQRPRPRAQSPHRGRAPRLRSLDCNAD